MNGQKVFEKLSAMTEDERKYCSFWWLTGKSLIESDMQFILTQDFDDLYDEDLEELITADQVSQILDEAEENMSEYSVDSFWEEFQGRYYGAIEDKIKEKLCSEKEEEEEVI